MQNVQRRVCPLYLSIFASVVSKRGDNRGKYICGKTRGCFFLLNDESMLLQPVTSTFVHWTTIISSSSKALNPSTTPVVAVLQLTQPVLSCVCLSWYVCSIVHAIHPMAPRWISTMHALQNQDFNPCFWSPFHPSIHHPVIHPSIHCTHPCVYQSIHCHLFINPLLFKRVHPCFRKDKIPEEPCLFVFKAAILDTNLW